MPAVKKLQVLSENEEEIAERISRNLTFTNKSEEVLALETNRTALFDLANSISRYPSILREQTLMGVPRSIETLVSNLCVRDSVDLLFHMPTKALLGKGFAVAKINFFFMLLYLSRSMSELWSEEPAILSVINKNIFTIMAEDVFLSLIADQSVSLHVRTNAAYLLANVWEYRIDHGVKEFMPILDSLWRARKDIRCAFGTLTGVSELFGLADRLGASWLEFLSKEELSQEEVDSLREFLFGLSYEEMKRVLGEMEGKSRNSIDSAEIAEILGDDTNYPEYAENDPREFYRSFRHRKRNAISRLRNGSDGPKRTLEEYIMIYLLSRPAQWLAGSD